MQILAGEGQEKTYNSLFIFYLIKLCNTQQL